MNKVVTVVLALAGGFGLGYLVGKKVADDQAEARIRDEVESAKESFRKEVQAAVERGVEFELKRREEEAKKDEKAADKTEKPAQPDERVMKEYRKAAESYGDPQQNDDPAENAAIAEKDRDEIREMAKKLKPQIIPSEDVGEISEYGEPCQLVYYADDVLVDERGDPDGVWEKDEIQEYLGTEWIEYMKTHDECHIVNHRKKAYYDITADSSTWDEVLQNKPYLRY